MIAPHFERKFLDASEAERKRKIAILTDQYRPLKGIWYTIFLTNNRERTYEELTMFYFMNKKRNSR
jgi:hypothetical protein